MWEDPSNSVSRSPEVYMLCNISWTHTHLPTSCHYEVEMEWGQHDLWEYARLLWAEKGNNFLQTLASGPSTGRKEEPISVPPHKSKVLQINLIHVGIFLDIAIEEIKFFLSGRILLSVIQKGHLFFGPFVAILLFSDVQSRKFEYVPERYFALSLKYL